MTTSLFPCYNRSMKKTSVIICCCLLALICPVVSVSAISEGQKNSIIDNCEKIKDSLKNVQKLDSKARVFLGSHFETVYSKYITTLNVRLVENNLSRTNLINNQSEYATAKVTFVNDYISYQQGLEDLVAMDCRAEPEGFYNKLTSVREKRKKMVSDVSALKSLASKNVKFVTELKESL